MKLFINIVVKGIYLFYTVAWNYRKKIGLQVCKKEFFFGLEAHRKRGKSVRASPTLHHTLHESGALVSPPQPLIRPARDRFPPLKQTHRNHCSQCVNRNKPYPAWFSCRRLSSLPSRRLEVVGTKKKRAREKETREAPSPLACLPRACPFSLSPTTSKRLLRRLVLEQFGIKNNFSSMKSGIPFFCVCSTDN